ncbi:MAG TPA: CHASE3 domain-containing protein, partial [Polyangiaceae bacterium]|nr:CHASE3 domain-containing protein [Polyangiaceae bacterium]
MPTIALPRISVVGFTLATSGVFGLAALTWDQTQQTQRAQSWVNHTQEVMTALGSAESQLFRAEANQRSYLVDMAPEFALRREAAVGELLGQLDALARLTVDNTAQRGRLGALRSMIELRVREFRTLQSRLEAGQELSAKDRLAEGANARALISPRFQEMVNEEARLLAFRQDAERQRTSAARGIFIGLVAGLALLLAGMLWRLGVDAGARRRAELAAAQERSYDTMHVRALTLYNETTTREEALSGTLELLANSPLFPVSAFYAHEEI